MKDKIELNLISTETKEQGHDYNETLRTYECPCGKGKVVWSKERPNGKGYGYQAMFSDIYCLCENCKDQYDFKRSKGSAFSL